ncbi:MAG: hypothetical protein F9K16_01340 [Thermoanaerobaculia bacterium]|nr:MAG: hypothetical protein F9K16_01340 [Thermoanaerobaculia bacterium]MBZ0102143.1 hypothetical protein [Thermoanaerobaculia bacterium]
MGDQVFGERQGALDVELVDLGIVAVDLGERQLLLDARQVGLVRLLVDRALVEVGADDPLLALLEHLEPLLDGSPLLGDTLLLLVPALEHRGGEELQHLRPRREAVEELDEPRLELLLRDVDPPAPGAVVVGVARPLPLRPRSRERLRAVRAAHEAPEREVRMVALVAGEERLGSGDRGLGLGEGLLVDERLEVAGDVDAPVLDDHPAVVDGLAQQLVEHPARQLGAAPAGEAATAHLSEDLGDAMKP